MSQEVTIKQFKNDGITTFEVISVGGLPHRYMIWWKLNGNYNHATIYDAKHALFIWRCIIWQLD